MVSLPSCPSWLLPFWFCGILALVLVPAPAGADASLCETCCRAAGLSGCHARLRVVGPGSQVVEESNAQRVKGLWRLACDGSASFEPGSTVVLAETPAPGEVIRLGSPAVALHCFAQACSLPAGACLRLNADRRLLVRRCGSGEPLQREDLARKGPPPPGSEAVLAVVDERPLVVVPDAPLARTMVRPRTQCPGCARANGNYAVEAPRAAVVTPGGGNGGRASWSPAAGGSAPSGTSSGAGGGGWSATQASPTGTTGASSPPATSSPTRSEDLPSIEVPSPPEDARCRTSDALRKESRKHGDLGNEAVIRDDPVTARDEYRAAIALDPCNAYAWADLGALALRVGDVGAALAALEQAVRFMPRHYTAWTHLGQAREAQGRYGPARDAFRRALEIRPGHPPALEGLRRVQVTLRAQGTP